MNPARKSKVLIAAAIGSALMLGAAAPQTDSASVHVARATAAAGAEYAELLTLCRGPKDLEAMMARKQAEERVAEEPSHEPQKVFDNFYYVGTKQVASWAITTSAGIILIDSLNAADVEGLVAHMRQLGLDPATIRYVVITHGHSDHFGGSKYLQEKFGAKVVMSAIDWDNVLNKKISGAKEPPPRHDLDAPPSLTLGDETIRILPTPGHTPGAVSLLIPVREGSRRHVVALLGGLTYPKAVEAVPGYLKGHADFAAAAAKAQADVLASNHPMNDWGLDKLRALKTKPPGSQNPFIVGRDGVDRYMTVGLECARASYAGQLAAKP